MKLKVDRKNVERGIYVGLIIGLVIYGFWDSDNAEKLINAVCNAFSILINNNIST